MNLRLRLTLFVAVTFALVVIGCTYAAHLSASSQLRSEVDSFLIQRSSRFTHVPSSEFGRGPQDPDGDGTPGGPNLADPDAVTQILDRSGRVYTYNYGQPVLPINATDRTLAQKGGRSCFRDIKVAGEPYRMLTVALSSGGAVEIARGVESNNNVLSTLDARLLLIALFGSLLAATLAWLIARRTVHPIEALTDTATYVAATQDLTNPIVVARNDEVGRLASSFNSMLDALRTSREQQRRLVMDASHELRTPLTALRTNIELLQRAKSYSADQREELLTATGVELRELTDLVSELVELATDTHNEEVEQHVDLAELAERVVTRQRRRSGREITLEAEPGAVVRGRVTLLERAISNLLDNALKFSPHETTVAVTVRSGVVEVLDRGAGIPPEDLPHVFDRFYRSPTARGVPGSGLGLAIVEQIAELHRGSVKLVPREGGGIVARLDLQGALATEPAPGPAADQPASPAN